MRKASYVKTLLYACLLAFYLLITLYMRVSPAQAGDEIRLLDAIFHAVGSFSWVTLIHYLLLAALAYMALFVPERKETQPVFVAAGALFMTFCMLVGKAFIDPDWGHLVIRLHPRCIIKELFCMPGWFLTSFCAIKLLYDVFDTLPNRLMKNKNRKKNALFSVFDAHPFLSPFVLLLACYLPVAMISFPGLVESGDTVPQILQFDGVDSGGYHHIYTDSMLNNHHPILHSVLLRAFLEIGKGLFSSATIGMGLFVVLQVILTAAVLSYALMQLHEEGAPGILCMGAALILGLHPRVQNFIILVSKDMVYAMFLLLWGIAVVKVNKGEARSLALLLVSSLGCLFMRNEGIYILMISFCVIFVLRRKIRMQAAAALLLCAAVWGVWTNVVFPALRISPGSVREMLSIPFQQTARVIARNGDAVTPEEQQAIDGVLPYEELGLEYKPDIADGVKNLYREEADGEAKAAYLKTWFSMLFKHPMVYVEAFLENKNLYLYPTMLAQSKPYTLKSYDASYADAAVINRDCRENGVDISIEYPKALQTARMKYERTRESVFSLPLLWLATQCSPVIWAVVLMTLYALSRRKWMAFILLVPVVLQMLVVFVGPTDGFLFRYVYPIVLYLPFCGLYAMYENKTA